MKGIEKMVTDVFKTAPIGFKFDFEDYENCRLNGEIKKMISYMKITVPIVHMHGTSTYFIGIKHVNLHLKGAFIHVIEDLKENITTSTNTIRFNDYISKY